MNIHTIARGETNERLKAYFRGLMTQFGHPAARCFVGQAVAGTRFTHALAVQVAGFPNLIGAKRAQGEIDAAFADIAKLARVEPIFADGLTLWITHFVPAPSDTSAFNSRPASFAANHYANLTAVHA